MAAAMGRRKAMSGNVTGAGGRQPKDSLGFMSEEDRPPRSAWHACSAGSQAGPEHHYAP